MLNLCKFCMMNIKTFGEGKILMITITANSLRIPIYVFTNNNVRMQYYNFLMENYDEVCIVDTKS